MSSNTNDTNASDEPTQGFNRWNNEVLQDSNQVLEDRIKELESSVSVCSTTNRIQDQQIKNTEQKIYRIKIFGIVTISAILISLGVDVEQIDKVLKVVAFVAGTGLIWTASEKKGRES